MAIHEYIVLHTSGVTIPNINRVGGALVEKALNGIAKTSTYPVNFHQQFEKFVVDEKVLSEDIDLNQFLCALEKNQIILRVGHEYKNVCDLLVNGEDMKAPALIDSAIEIEKFYKSVCSKEALQKYLEKILVKAVKRD
jgi:hypothetical protein